MAITLAQFSVANANDLSGISDKDEAISASGICATCKIAMNSDSEIFAESINCRTLTNTSDSGLLLIGTDRADPVTVAEAGRSPLPFSLSP